MFYTYLWLRKDGTPYYAGKGLGNRAFIKNGHSIPRPKNDACILVQYWESEDKAFEMEKWFISLFGRKDNNTGILRNLTNGGEGMSGHIASEELCRKRREASKGKRYSLGAVRSEETRRKISESMKGKQNSLGMVHTAETIRKMRVVHTGVKFTEAARYKLSASMKGNKNSPGWPKGKPMVRKHKWQKKKRKTLANCAT